MPAPIVILHGWSDSSRSLGPLAKFLSDELRTSVTTIDLADWVSLDDEITYRDLRHAMQSAWTRQPELRGRTDACLVSHSTGALVVRDWMTTYYTPDTVPFRRHLMLAPANFGSQLAHKGRAWYGRVFKGWKSHFQTGAHLLRGLELASPYSWELAERDVFSRQRWYGGEHVLAAVLVGDSGYGGVAAVTDEPGGDGTVRVSTANLNAAWIEVDFASDPAQPRLKVRTAPKNEIAFGVCPGENHSTVAFKTAPRGDATRAWILRALRTPPGQWPRFVQDLEESNQRHYAQAIEKPDYFHAHQNTVLRVRDDLGNPIEEYLLEFNQGSSRRFSATQFGALFQRKIVQDVHPYSGDSSLRSFLVNVSLLEEEMRKDFLFMELEAFPVMQGGMTVGYPKLPRIRIESQAVTRFFEPNRTLLLDVRVPRNVEPRAFQLRRHAR